MVVRATARQVVLPWLILGPLIAGAGAIVGFWWRGAAPEAGERDTRVVAVPSFAPIVDRARGAVVGVRTIHRMDPEVLLGDATITEHQPAGVTRGTGFLIHEDGLIVTAHHVVAQPSMIVVEVPGVGAREAMLVGEDPATDVAVVRLIDAPPGLPVLELGRSGEIRQGDWVVTIGHPLDLQHVSAGVIGYVGRHLLQDGHGITNEYLQFAAQADPGSSGSPVLDLHGEVVGMTTRAAAGGEGIAFAVTSHVLGHVLDSMERNGGRVRRAYFGATAELASGKTRLGHHESASGLAIELSSVAKGHAAHKSGLRDGDIVVALAGRPIRSLGEFYDTLTWAAPGTQLALDVIRNGEPLPGVSVELGELGEPPQDLVQ